jgi:hypothetical protein
MLGTRNGVTPGEIGDTPPFVGGEPSRDDALVDDFMK